jgi:putative glutamine amidotransferase
VSAARTRKPVVGISCGLNPKVSPDGRPSPLGVDLVMVLPMRYLECVVGTGATAVGLPMVPADRVEDLLDVVDALVVVGGPDVPPSLYGAENTACETLVVPERIAADTALIRAAMARDLPMLGICYGHQIVNVLLGGTLIQDIATQVPNAVKHRRVGEEMYPSHDVRIEPRSRLAEALGADGACPMSSHHQAVATFGAGMRPVAAAPDGVNEATEHESCRFLLTVQWHPEMTPGAEPTRRLFRALVDAIR